MTENRVRGGLTTISGPVQPVVAPDLTSKSDIYPPKKAIAPLVGLAFALTACAPITFVQNLIQRPAVAEAGGVTEGVVSEAEIQKLQMEPITVDEIRLIQQDIPYIDENGVAHVNSGSFMEFERIDTGNGPGIVVPKDPHIRARLEWLAIHHPTGDKTGNWQNPGDFKGEATAGDAREYWKVLELWGPGSAAEGEWKTMLFPGQSVEAGADTRLAGSEWSYAAVLDGNNQPTPEGWTEADVLADILFSIARRATFTVVSPEVRGWVNGQSATGFLTVQDAVQAGWLQPRVPLAPAVNPTPHK